MATLRQFVRDMTSLPVGSSIRDSIENPSEGSGTGTGETIYIDRVEYRDTINNIYLSPDKITLTEDIITLEIESEGYEFTLEEVEEQMELLDYGSALEIVEEEITMEIS